jgi:phospholipid transport system substrate-binding protein
MKKSIWISCLLLVGLGAASAVPVTPLEVIKQSNKDVLEFFRRHPQLNPELESELLAIIREVTDFKMISSLVIERFCADLDPEQCRTFDQTFQRLLEVTSIKKLGRYRADAFDYIGEEVEENGALVKTIAHYKDDRVELNYHLSQKEGKWLIVNFIVDDVDTIRNYKKQFTRLFARMNFDQIMERLQKKIEEYENELQYPVSDIKLGTYQEGNLWDILRIYAF